MYIQPRTRGRKISGTRLKAAQRRDARHRNRNMRVHSAWNQDEHKARGPRPKAADVKQEGNQRKASGSRPKATGEDKRKTSGLKAEGS